MSHLNRAARRAASSIAIGSLLVAPSMASAAGTQPVDVTAELECSAPIAGLPASIRVTGTVPASTRQGEFLDTSNLAVKVRHQTGDAPTHGPAPHAFYAGSPSLTFELGGGEGGAYGGWATTTPSAISVGAGTFEVASDSEGPRGAWVGGTAPVKLALSHVFVNFTVMSPSLALSGPVPRDTQAHCAVKGGPVAMATIANAGAATSSAPTIAVSSATPQAGISSLRGGLLYLRGTNLKGLRTIKFGPHTVRVVLNTGSTIYALVPPLPDGTWPVTASRADGTTTAVNSDVTVTIYGG